MNTKLKEARLAARLTQEELSEKSGVPLTTIQKLESGEQDLLKTRIDTVLVLTKALGISIAELVGD